MSYSNYEFDEKRVHDAWGSWNEVIDDRTETHVEVIFKFSSTTYDQVRVVVPNSLATQMIAGEMKDEVKDFLDSDEGQGLAGYLSEVNKPSWVKNEHDPDVECFEVLLSDHEGGES